MQNSNEIDSAENRYIHLSGGSVFDMKLSGSNNNNDPSVFFTFLTTVGLVGRKPNDPTQFDERIFHLK